MSAEAVHWWMDFWGFIMSYDSCNVQEVMLVYSQIGRDKQRQEKASALGGSSMSVDRRPSNK